MPASSLNESKSFADNELLLISGGGGALAPEGVITVVRDYWQTGINPTRPKRSTLP
jgi:hypothetical protein